MTAMDDASRQPPVDREEMARQLKANIRKQRPRYYPTLGLTLAILAIAVALVAWRFWPRPALPPLNLLALDQIARPGETVVMEAWLAPRDPRSAADLGGLDIAFAPLLLLGRADAPLRDVEVRSAPSGRAEASLAAPAGEEVVDIKVFHVPSQPGQRTEDRARLFVWKPQTPLLLVEVAAVADAGPDAWQGKRLDDISPRPSAGEALQAAHAKHYQVVYVATGAPTPMAYRLMRAWVETRSQENGPFPDGPVLGQLPPGGSPTGRDWAERLKQIVQRWPGQLAAVVKDPELGEVLRAAGARTFVLTAQQRFPVPPWQP
jgi:hypothetical protein